MLAYILSFFHRMAPAAISGELQQSFQASGVALGTLAASYFYVYMLMQIPTGVLVDTLGVRKVVTIGGLVAGGGSILFGSADTLVIASVGRLLVGLGVSVMFLSAMKINAVWFHERHFGTMSGLTILFGNLGAVLAAAPLAWVLAYTSWRTVFVGIGIYSIVLGILSWFMVRNSPAEAGLPTMREVEGRNPHPPHQGDWYHGLIQVMKNRETWPGFWPALGVAGTLFTFAGLWAVPYLYDVYGMSRAMAANHTAVLLTGFAVGSLFAGSLSDRMGKRRPVIIAGVVMYSVCWLPMLLGWQLGLIASYSLFALMGLSASGFTLSWASAKEVNPPALSGMATGVVNIGPFLGAAILQPLIGWTMDLGWDGTIVAGVRVYSVENYQIALGIMLAFSVIGLIGALRIRETYCRYVSTA
ncbi:MAG: MFS transporter [Anaerolineae bacterium]